MLMTAASPSTQPQEITKVEGRRILAVMQCYLAVDIKLNSFFSSPSVTLIHRLLQRRPNWKFGVCQSNCCNCSQIEYGVILAALPILYFAVVGGRHRDVNITDLYKISILKAYS